MLGAVSRRTRKTRKTSKRMRSPTRRATRVRTLMLRGAASISRGAFLSPASGKGGEERMGMGRPGGVVRTRTRASCMARTWPSNTPTAISTGVSCPLRLSVCPAVTATLGWHAAVLPKPRAADETRTRVRAHAHVCAWMQAVTPKFETRMRSPRALRSQREQAVVYGPCVPDVVSGQRGLAFRQEARTRALHARRWHRVRGRVCC